jgi:hypothetical protein
MADFENGTIPDPNVQPYGFHFYTNSATNSGIYTWTVDTTRGANGTSNSMRFDITEGYPYFYWLSFNDAALVPTSLGMNRFEFYVSAPPGWIAGHTYQNFNIGTYLRNEWTASGNETDNLHEYIQLNLDFTDTGWMHVVVGGDPCYQRNISPGFDPASGGQRPFVSRFFDRLTRFYLCGWPNPDTPVGVPLPYSMWFDEFAFYYQNNFVVAGPSISVRHGQPGQTVYHAATITNTHPTESRVFGLRATGPYDSTYTWQSAPPVLFDANGDGQYEPGEDTVVTQTPPLAPGESYHVLVKDVIPSALTSTWPDHRITLVAWQQTPAYVPADVRAHNDSPNAYRGDYDTPLDTAMMLTKLGATVTGTLPPAAVTDLALQTAARESATVGWVAPAGGEGGVMAYDVRLCTQAITAANWALATPLADASMPYAAGTAQTMILPGLQPGTTYYVALEAIDEAGNRSPVSNCVSFTTTP